MLNVVIVLQTSKNLTGVN